MPDPFDSPGSRDSSEQRYGSLDLDPSVAPERQAPAIQYKKWQTGVAALIFFGGIIGAILVLWIGEDPETSKIAWKFQGSTFKGGLAGCIIVAAAIVAWLFVRQPVRHRSSSSKKTA